MPICDTLFNLQSSYVPVISDIFSNQQNITNLFTSASVITSTMKGILLDKVGGDFHLVDTLEKPSPGNKQILVKSLVTAINPVYGYPYPHLSHS